MARGDKFQNARIKQKSAFLKLPGEIRTLIYRAALVKDTPIDLWPHKFIENNFAHSELVDRLAKAKVDSIEWTRVRDQHDLNYVRKEMATGILATCKQVRMEATMIFWRENSFRFSGDFDWRGLRRFLVSIGPEARSRIRSLHVCPPGWQDTTYNPITHGLDNTQLGQYCEPNKAVAAKNHPKMRMAKSLPFSTQGKKNYQHEDNIRFVRETLRSEESLRNLNFVIMDGWSFSQLDDVYYEYPWAQTASLAEFQQLKHFCNISVILESGSAMLGPHNREFLNYFDITLIAQPGSRVVDQRPFKEWVLQAGLTDAKDVTELQTWAPVASDDLLIDSFKIFNETDRIDLPARGGRAVKSTCYGQKKMERKLKGFGGCRFVQRYGEYCIDCNQYLKDARTTMSKHKYWCIHCKGKTGILWKDGIEVRKVSRERRVAQQGQEADEDAWWQG
jgi:hypothetical protein